MIHNDFGKFFALFVYIKLDSVWIPKPIVDCFAIKWNVCIFITTMEVQGNVPLNYTVEKVVTRRKYIS